MSLWMGKEKQPVGGVWREGGGGVDKESIASVFSLRFSRKNLFVSYTHTHTENTHN